MWLLRHARGNPETELCQNLNTSSSSLTLLKNNSRGLYFRGKRREGEVVIFGRWGNLHEVQADGQCDQRCR